MVTYKPPGPIKHYCREKLLSSHIDNDLKDEVLGILDLCNNVVGYKVNKWSFIVQSQESATCPLGWQHVYVDKGLCCGLR